MKPAMKKRINTKGPLGSNKAKELFTRYSRKIDRYDYINNCISNQIKHEKIKKGLRSHQKNFFNSMHLNFLRHGHHELGFEEVFNEKF